MYLRVDLFVPGAGARGLALRELFAAPPSPASLLCALATHAGAVCVRRAVDIPLA